MAEATKKITAPMSVNRICRPVSCWMSGSIEVSVVERIMAMPKMISSVTAPNSQKSKCLQILPRSIGLQVEGCRWKVLCHQRPSTFHLPPSTFHLLPSPFASPPRRVQQRDVRHQPVLPLGLRQRDLPPPPINVRS